MCSFDLSFNAFEFFFFFLNLANGNTETAVIEDRCQGCQEFDLDMTPDLFNKFADPATGRIHITWRFA